MILKINKIYLSSSLNIFDFTKLEICYILNPIFGEFPKYLIGNNLTLIYLQKHVFYSYSLKF